MSRGISKPRVAIALSALAMTALALTGCSANGVGAAAPSAKKLIAVSISDQTSLFYIAEVDGIKNAAKAAGYEVVIQQAGDDGTTQVNQVQNLITQQPAAVIFTPTNETAANAGAKLLNNAKIPIITVDEKPLDSDGRDIVTFIATDSVAAAKDDCTFLFKQINNSGDILELTGVEGSTAQLQRSEGCGQALAATPGVKIVGSGTAAWDETKAFNLVQNLLTAHPGVKAIFAESDAMALGAAKAAAQAHLTLPIVGIDGFPSMFDAIKTGSPTATEAQQPYMMGQLAVKNAIQAIEGNGKSIPKTQYQKTILITKDNVDQNPNAQFYGPTVN